MSVIATAVRHLMAAGVNGDALIEAIEALEAEIACAPKKRSAGAIRQERYRNETIAKRLPDKEWYPLVGQVVRRDGGKCYYCGATGKLGADHVLPLSRGGSNDIDNLVACCSSCNKSKGGRTVEEWKSGNSPRHGNVTVTVGDDCDAVVTPLSLPPNENISNPPTHTPGDNTRARKGASKNAPPAKPEGVSDQTWTDFLDLRKRKGAPLTETALKGIVREAGKAGWPLEATLEKCLIRGWQGFEADWLKGEKPPTSAVTPASDPLMRSIMARQARKTAA